MPAWRKGEAMRGAAQGQRECRRHREEAPGRGAGKRRLITFSRQGVFCRAPWCGVRFVWRNLPRSRPLFGLDHRAVEGGVKQRGAVFAGKALE